MSGLALINHVSQSTDVAWSRITQLDTIMVNGTPILFATTRYDGEITSWNISSGSLSLRDADAYSGVLRAGGTGAFTTIMVDGQSTLISGGGVSGMLALRGYDNTGRFQTETMIQNTAGTLGGLVDMQTVTLSNGNQVVYGGLAGETGIGQVRLGTDGAYITSRTTFVNGYAYDDQITALAYAQVNGTDFLFSASSTENGISTWVVTSTGNLTNTSDLGNDEGLWITAPTALEAVTIGTNTYLVLASAGSSSLSVMRVETDGSLTITEHLLDTRDTRFGGVTSLEVITYNGQTYVIAGGADDGLSVFVMLPSGQLVARTYIADTDAMALDNISAIAAQGRGDGIDIFVASSSETGISQLYFDTGPAGSTQTAWAAGGALTGAGGADVLIGGAGDDLLTGGAGDDIIQDGRGRDTMSGGPGADIFTLIFDGEVDTITDFQIGVDQIDLGGWPMVRDLSQLTMAMTSTGMTITYGDELLIIQSADGQLIDHRLLATSDLIGGARIPQVILPGYAGPITPDPDLPGRYIPPAPETGGTGRDSTISIGSQSFQISSPRNINGMSYTGNSRSNRIDGTRKNDWLAGKDGNDRVLGGDGDDRLYGGYGNDVLIGGDDHDTLIGGRGDDTIYGGQGRDLIKGDSGRGTLYGGYGDDRIYGGDDSDLIYGGQQNDRIYGGRGNNRIDGGAGHDLITAGSGSDRLLGGSGRDLISGGKGNDRLYGQEGHDTLRGGDGNDLIYGGDDFDLLIGENGYDTIGGGDGYDTIVGGNGSDRITGGNGADQIYGGQGRDKIFGGQGADYIEGGADHDIIWGGRGHDTILGGDGNDVIKGWQENDRIYGGNGYDELQGNAGNDTIFGGNGNDLIYGFGDNDVLYGGRGNDTISGGYKHDLIYGMDDNDRLGGSTGNDTIFGGNGNDTLIGGQGQDTLDGGNGNDQLTGGDHPDTFIFNSGNDTITDFEEIRDTLLLDNRLWDGNLSPAEVLLLYGSIDGTIVTIDFENGNTLSISGVTDYDTFQDHILLI